MKKVFLWVVVLPLALALAAPARAHFGVVIPSTSTVQDKAEAALTIDVGFVHPMERNGMDMALPRAFAVHNGGQQQDLKAQLKEKTMYGKKAWQTTYALNKPGVYQFVLEPEPYFEPAEDCYIVHYTKAIVPAFGEEDGWDEALGLKTEIVPLTRPFGNYAGNVFQGKVLLDGKPVANCDVEVEYFNRDGKYEAPNDYFVTQVVKTDANGVFTYAAPWAGWWGFAALNTASEKMEHKGQPRNVELGAVLWVEFTAPKMAGK